MKKKSFFIKTAKAVIFSLLGIITAFAIFIIVKILSLDAWHEFDPNKILNAPETLIIYDNDGNEYTRIDNGEDRVRINIESIPEDVKSAFISAEDARYYEHHGIDVIRIFGALWQDIKAGSYVQGASTITQQLIKLSHLTPEKTMTRKLEEAVMAYRMEKEFSKDEILEMYLNYVYFGRGYYGIEAASKGYFGIPASEMNIAQSATLAAILKSPSKYAPHLHPEASKQRRDNIIGLMYEYGHIDAAEKDIAINYPLTIIPEIKYSRGYYVDTALREAADMLGINEEEVISGGYRIYTCADMELQHFVESQFNNESLFPTEECNGAAAVVRCDDFSVAAIVGGKSDDTALAFNRATDIRRQPGSVIKPIIVYAPALESGEYTAASLLLDERTDFSGYSPKNFNDKYYGWITLREAVRRSLNVPAVKLMAQLGVDVCKNYAESIGIDFVDSDDNLALALGGFTHGVSPLQIAGAYAVFAAGGVYDKPYTVRLIKDYLGNTVYAHTDCSSRVMGEENAYIITDMLKSAINEGTGKRLGALKLGLAGKTGTVGNSDGNRDAWMTAYNSEYSMCVWMGYDSEIEGIMPNEATGGNFPALMLGELFSFTSDRHMPDEIEMPEGVIKVSIDRTTLENERRLTVANVFTPESKIMTEIFRKGTEPTETTEYWNVPESVENLTVDLDKNGYPIIKFSPRDSETVYNLFRVSDNGIKQKISEWRGTDGVVVYRDVVSIPGVYSYYIQPEHPELVVNGKKVIGIKTWSTWIRVIPHITDATGQEMIEIYDSEF